MRVAPFGYICFAVKTAAADLLQGLDNIWGYQRHCGLIVRKPSPPEHDAPE
jgi:hypothetical protein